MCWGDPRPHPCEMATRHQYFLLYKMACQEYTYQFDPKGEEVRANQLE